MEWFKNILDPLCVVVLISALFLLVSLVIVGIPEIRALWLARKTNRSTRKSDISEDVSKSLQSRILCIKAQYLLANIESIDIGVKAGINSLALALNICNEIKQYGGDSNPSIALDLAIEFIIQAQKSMQNITDTISIEQ